jgi:RNA polymerase sigma-70 factor, ECF subfamily
MGKDAVPGEGTELSDAQLVASATRGDTEAYRVLVERYQSRVFAIAFEIVKSREDAEDIAQESFVKAYFSLGSFKGDSSFFTWLYRIVHNMAFDVRRKLLRRGGATLEYDEVKVAQGEGTQISSGVSMGKAIIGPQEAVLNRETATLLQKALAEISEEHRSVVVLREIDGLSYDEIAKVTGVSKGTVMSRLFYARKKLQQVLHEYAPAEASTAGNSIK